MKSEKLIVVLNYVGWCLLALSIISIVLLISSNGGNALIIGVSGGISSLFIFSLAHIIEALDVSANNSSVIAEELIKLNDRTNN